MIKLIATDMDGTLLNDQKQLPSAFPQLLSLLKKKGISFAIASGRSYSALAGLFGELVPELLFICDNGGNIKLPNQPPVYQCLPTNAVHQVLDLCQTLPNVVPVLCCTENIFYPQHAKAQFQQEITNFYVQFSAVPYDRLYAITEPVIKIAFCAMDGAAEHLYPALAAAFGTAYELVISGNCWMDMMCRNVSKGNAIAALQRQLGITRAETMVFGDYQNDISMFAQADYSYAMAQAGEDVKQAAAAIAPSNNENGVVRTICEVLQISPVVFGRR